MLDVGESGLQFKVPGDMNVPIDKEREGKHLPTCELQPASAGEEERCECWVLQVSVKIAEVHVGTSKDNVLHFFYIFGLFCL